MNVVFMAHSITYRRPRVNYGKRLAEDGSPHHGRVALLRDRNGHAARFTMQGWGEASRRAADGDGTPSLPPHPMVGPPFHRRPRGSAALPYVARGAYFHRPPKDCGGRRWIAKRNDS